LGIDLSRERRRKDNCGRGSATSPTPEAGRSWNHSWDVVIRAKHATNMLPVLESVLAAFGRFMPGQQAVGSGRARTGGEWRDWVSAI